MASTITNRSTGQGGPKELMLRHPVPAYVALTFAISWGYWIPMGLFAGTVSQGVGWPSHLPGLMGPLLAAAVVTGVTEGREGLRRFWADMVSWRLGRWWLAVPVTLAGGAIGLFASSDGFSWSDVTTYSGVSTGMGALATIVVVLIVNGFGEEAGWRGFAVPRLLKTRSLTATSLLVTMMWAPWHLPLFFFMESFAGFSVAEIVGWIVGLTAGSFLLTWLYRGSGGSILLVAVWHTTFNFTSGTAATAGTAAAISSTLVMIAAVWIAIADRRSH